MALAFSGASPAFAASTEDVAREYVSAHADQFGVRPADVSDLSVLSSYQTSGTGVTHVNLAQRREGYDVFGTEVTVSIGRDGRIVFSGGSLVKGLQAGPATAMLDATDAVEAAAKGLGLDAPAGLQVKSAGAQKAVMTGGGISDSPIDAKLGWHSSDGQLRLAWQVLIDDSTEPHLWDAKVDARTGALLDHADLTIHEDIDDIDDSVGRKAISRNFAPPAFTLVTPNPVNDGSSYRVFAFPTESPNDADRVLLNNPADALTSPFGWHDTDGVAGAQVPPTPGNNVPPHMGPDDNKG